jgi:hypothetical protein
MSVGAGYSLNPLRFGGDVSDRFLYVSGMLVLFRFAQFMQNLCFFAVAMKLCLLVFAIVMRDSLLRRDDKLWHVKRRIDGRF